MASLGNPTNAVLVFRDNQIFNYSYQFISILVSIVLGHPKRVFLKKGEQVCMKKESDKGLRSAKVTRLLAILI